MKQLLTILLMMLSFNSFAQLNTPQVNLSLIQLKFNLGYANRDMFLRPCLIAENICGFTANEAKVGLDIFNNSANYAGLDFESSSKAPNLFLRDSRGFYQVVGTANQRGALIHVNIDRLLEPLTRIIGMDKVIEYLTTAFFFQQTNNWELSALSGSKVGKYWSSKLKSNIPILFKEESIEMLFFKNKEVRLLLLDDTQAYNLNFEIVRKMTCSKNFMPVMLTGYANDKWVDFQNRADFAMGKLRVDLTYQCADTSGQSESWTGTINLTFQFKPSPIGKKVFDPRSLVIGIDKTDKSN